MWRELFTSGAFWGSAARSYVINITFGLFINVFLSWGKTTIPFLDGFHGDMAAAFASSAFFCGLFTPMFSSCFIRRKVQRGAIKPPAATAVAQSWFACLLRQGTCARSFILAGWDLVIFGTATVLVGGSAKHIMQPAPCELEVWAFLVLLVVWCVPVQVQTSLLNYAAAAHCSRRSDADPLTTAGQGDVEGSMAMADTSPNEQYLMAAVKMSETDIAGFPAFFADINPDVHQKYKDLCKEQNTFDDYMANPLVFILANNPQCCVHIAREYVDIRSPCSTTDRTEGSFASAPASTSSPGADPEGAADGSLQQRPQCAVAA
mmetsp:Transcript_36521/g.105202  ORF Transcript_36521/g.105202 Transcript_36521/m.105202 type:complete len:319 (-) Transcript_36521:116-1072(-)